MSTYNPAGIPRTASISESKSEETSLLLILLLLLGGLLLFLFFLLLLTLLLDNSSGDTVEVTLAVLRDAAATVLSLLEHTDLLEALADLALNGAGSVAVVRRAVTAALAATVEAGERTDTDVLAEVDVACYGGYTYNINFPSL